MSCNLNDELQKDARQGLYKSLEHLSAENELYRVLLNEKFAQIVEQDGGVLRFPYSNLERAKVPELVERPGYSFQLLFEWLRQYGFNTDQCRFIFETMNTGIGNKYFSSTHQLIIGRDELQLSEIKAVENEEVQIGVGEDVIVLPIHLCFSKLEKTPDFVIDKSSDVAQLDFDKLKFPLTFRHWRHGDRFHPLGMKGSKLLSDFFVDQKFTEWQKRNVWLLVSADDEIFWVVGYRIDERFKVTDSTKMLFLCSKIE